MRVSETHQTQRSGGDYSDGGGGGGHKAPSWVGSIHITGPADTYVANSRDRKGDGGVIVVMMIVMTMMMMMMIMM